MASSLQFWLILLLAYIFTAEADDLSTFLQDYLRSNINFRKGLHEIVCPVNNSGDNKYKLVGGGILGLDTISVLNVNEADKEGVVFHVKFDKLECKCVGCSLTGTPSFYLGEWTSASTDTTATITLSLTRACTVHNTRVDFDSMSGFDNCTTCRRKNYIGIDTEDVLRRFRIAIETEIKSKIVFAMQETLNSISLKGRGVKRC